MSILLFLKKYLRKFGLVEQLDFDQQVWGAKSLMDIHQQGSKFFLAEGNNDDTVYTCWNGASDNLPYAITVDTNGFSTGPVQDSSKIGDCMLWEYPPKISCADAVIAMANAGITTVWQGCRLRQGVDPQYNPFYEFTFDTQLESLRGRNDPFTVNVDAVTGQVTKT